MQLEAIRAEVKKVEGQSIEFFRDLIADLNGMYQVMAVDPDLLSRARL